MLFKIEGISKLYLKYMKGLSIDKFCLTQKVEQVFWWNLDQIIDGVKDFIVTFMGHLVSKHSFLIFLIFNISACKLYG